MITSLIFITVLGVVAVAGVAASIVTTTHDGYRQQPTRRY
jgi:hypothetical protein